MIALRMTVCAALMTGVVAASSSIADEAKPSFNCKKATTKIEKLVCEDEFLGFRDGALGALYRALEPSRAKIPDLRSLMRHWLRGRDTVCGRAGARDKMDACLSRRYEAMLRRLSGRMARAGLGPAGRGLKPLAGLYVAKAEGFAGTIRLVELPDLSAHVEISTVSGRNAHICLLRTASARRTGNTVRWRDKDEPKCQVTLRFKDGTLKAEATAACRRFYCGANTDFIDFPYTRR
ncbi:MAG TPA: hypothetical protein VM325_00900 [Alphaproteobacteria bacterium]|nr:hypothetical protein [Alphaproteobacteria bacterium]